MSGWSQAPLAGPRWAGALSADVAELCARLRPRLGDRVGAALREIEPGLAGPLRVAVAGRVSAGKSTLVNALVGRRVAPTGAGECTRLVTRFQFGTVDRVEVVLRDQRRVALPFDAAGAVPADLGVDPAQVSHLDAYLTSAVLRQITVVDTPGLGGPDGDATARARQVLDPASAAALGGAEAVLYVVTQTVRTDDADLLAAFAAATGPGATGPANTIAVVNKVDTVPPESVPGSGGVAATAAALLAARQAEVLGHRVAGVVPVIGLLAETAETGAFTAADAEALRALAGTEPGLLDAMLHSADLFITLDAPVRAAARGRLLRLLDLHGITCLLDALRADAGRSTGSLRRLIGELSGLEPLRQRLATVFGAGADAIKASRALRAITTLAADCDAGQREVLDSAVEEALTRPQAHQLRLLDAVRQVSSGAVPLAPGLAGEIARLGGPDPLGCQLGLPGACPADLATHALRRASWWRSFAALDATPAQARVAEVVHRAYFLRWKWLCEGGPADG